MGTGGPLNIWLLSGAGPHRASSANLSKSNTESPWCKTRPRPAATVAAMRQNGIVWNRLRPFQLQPHAGRAVPPSKTSRSARPPTPGGHRIPGAPGRRYRVGVTQRFSGLFCARNFPKGVPFAANFSHPPGASKVRSSSIGTGDLGARVSARNSSRNIFLEARASSALRPRSVLNNLRPPGAIESL